MSIKPFETWVIRNKVTGEYWKARSGKQAWKRVGDAKNAWANSYHTSYWDGVSSRDVEQLCSKLDVKPVEDIRSWNKKKFIRPPYFNEQDTWECVNLTDQTISDKLTKTERLLKEIFDMTLASGGKCKVTDMIEEYFNE